MPTLDLYTVAAQAVLFIILWVALKYLWFDRALRLIHERNARSEGAVREARAIQAEADELRAAHAASLDQARAEAQREVQEIVRTAEAEQKRLLTAARDEAQRTLTDMRARVAEEVAGARRGLREDAGAIAREVVRKVLGRQP